MESLPHSEFVRLQQDLGPLLGCQLEFAAFEIQEDLGELTLNGEKYGGYVINYGTSSGPHYYCLVDPGRRSELPSGYDDYICWGRDDSDWSPAHGRLLSRLRRLHWSSFAGGESRVPSIGSPLDRYPGDGEMLCPEPDNGLEGRNADERLYLRDPRAYHAQVGTPDAASGVEFLSPAEYDHVACFLYPVKTDNPWLHSGPTETIEHLFEDPTKAQFLGDLGKALEVFDAFEGQDCVVRCTLTRHRPLSMRLEFEGGRFLTLNRLEAEDSAYGVGVKCCGGSSDAEAHSCCRAAYRLATDDGGTTGQLSYDELVELIEGWPLPA